MNIAFDLDGVLYPWQEVAVEYCSEYFNKQYDISTFFTEDIKNLSSTFVDNLVKIPTLYTSRKTDKNIIDML